MISKEIVGIFIDYILPIGLVIFVISIGYIIFTITGIKKTKNGDEQKSQMEQYIIDRIKELQGNNEWCLYQLNGENRIQKKPNPKQIDVWSNTMKDNDSRIDELKKLLKTIK
jgi:ABC-type transport system involved in cytochrome bd biosynthesis fused ATPase/permease subunit